MGALALFLFGIVTHHVATTAFAFAHDHFLDAQVVRHLLVTTWALENRRGSPRHRGASAYTRMYFPPLALSVLRLSWDTIPASPTNTHRLSFHPRRSSLTWATVLDIHGIARKHPVPHRQAIARHGQPDDDLRGIGAAIFRQAPFARRLVSFGTRCHTAFN